MKLKIKPFNAEVKRLYTDHGHFHKYIINDSGNGTAEEHIDPAGLKEPHEHEIRDGLVLASADGHSHDISNRRLYDQFTIEIYPADDPSSYRAIKNTTVERIPDELRDFILNEIPVDPDIPIAETTVDISGLSGDDSGAQGSLASDGPDLWPYEHWTGIMFDVANFSENPIRVNGKFSCLLYGGPHISGNYPTRQKSDIHVWYAKQTHKGIENQKPMWTR